MVFYLYAGKQHSYTYQCKTNNHRYKVMVANVGAQKW